jgi:hypothetical protein
MFLGVNHVASVAAVEFLDEPQQPALVTVGAMTSSVENVSPRVVTRWSLTSRSIIAYLIEPTTNELCAVQDKEHQGSGIRL